MFVFMLVFCVMMKVWVLFGDVCWCIVLRLCVCGSMMLVNFMMLWMEGFVVVCVSVGDIVVSIKEVRVVRM